MNIQQQNGIVSTIYFTPFLESDEYRDIRTTLFDQAMHASNIAPLNRLDILDESILVFGSDYQALSFLYHIFHAMVKLEGEMNCNITLRSSLCQGDYFLHQDQIYGNAVNLATKLSASSRENEMLVCGFDPETIAEFTNNHDDIACHHRDSEKNCVAISLLDQDSTNLEFDRRYFHFEINNQSYTFNLERNRRVSIGRSHISDIFIDSSLVSRNHATIILSDDSLAVEDHSSNGTYLYVDDQEILIAQDSAKLPGVQGNICCGFSRSDSNETADVISFMLCE